MKWIAVSLIAGASAIVGFVAGDTAETSAAIPVIRADPAPVKKRPADPGGMEIPFQDMFVYGLIKRGR